MGEQADERLDLFLADADEGRPLLRDGLSADTAVGAPRPKKESSYDRRLFGESWDDLGLQGWAVLAPESVAGDRALEAITPLLRLREREQRAPVKVYRAPEDLGSRAAAEWKKERFWPEGTPEEEVPLYLLILGDLHEISAELQHVLAMDTLVGRVHFARTGGEVDLEGYQSYAAKVVHFAEEGTPEAAPDLLFFTAPDGSVATVTGRTRLVAPSLQVSRQRLATGALPAASVREVSAESVDELCTGLSGERPGVLLSVSHGLGPPRGGFRSEEHKRQLQGAMLIDHSEVLDAERMSGRAFLPGGIWFYLACFGAGTPASSAYHPWLSRLSDEGAYGGSVGAVLRALPGEGERPFVAALPQAALASPRGPLAVIGHLDLAWTYGFSGTRKLAESRKSRILTPLEKLVQGHRAGVALGRLMAEYAEVNDDLMREYQIEQTARVQKRPSPLDPVEQAHRWMLRNDLRGYVLLGDPAARLPLRQHALRQAGGGDAEPTSTVSSEARELRSGTTATPGQVRPVAGEPPLAAGGPLGPEQAVLAMLMGETAPRAIAERAGVSLEVLWGWVDEYRAGGRTRLQG